MEWVIEDFLKYREPDAPERIWSPPKVVNSISFRLLIFPRGNASHGRREPHHVSAYLAIDPGDVFPPNTGGQWSMNRSAYQIVALNWRNWKEVSIVKNESFSFSSLDNDRGWTEFIPRDMVVRLMTSMNLINQR